MNEIGHVLLQLPSPYGRRTVTDRFATQYIGLQELVSKKNLRKRIEIVVDSL